jgi:sucrose phosphorylase
MLLARAIQLFTPGIPQIWYLDLFGGTNDYKAVEEGGSGAHKEINRTNLTSEQMKDRLKSELVSKQLELIQLRNTSTAFSGGMTLVESQDHMLHIKWNIKGEQLELIANLDDCRFIINHTLGKKRTSFSY